MSRELAFWLFFPRTRKYKRFKTFGDPEGILLLQAKEQEIISPCKGLPFFSVVDVEEPSLPSGLPFGLARPKRRAQGRYGRPDNKTPLLQGNPSAAKAQPSPAIFHCQA